MFQRYGGGLSAKEIGSDPHSRARCGRLRCPRTWCCGSAAAGAGYVCSLPVSHWVPPEGSDEEALWSFAAITVDLPAEVAAPGHDRCIVQLRGENVGSGSRQRACHWMSWIDC